MKKADKKHLQAVSELGCIVCRQNGYLDTPAEIHHIRAGQGCAQRSNNFQVLPLCHIHHRTGGWGVALHAGQKTWEATNGTELELLDKVRRLLEIDND